MNIGGNRDAACRRRIQRSSGCLPANGQSSLGTMVQKMLIMRLEGKVGEAFKGLIYCPYLHPELFREKGRIMPFTYCVLEDF